MPHHNSTLHISRDIKQPAPPDTAKFVFGAGDGKGIRAGSYIYELGDWEY